MFSINIFIYEDTNWEKKMTQFYFPTFAYVHDSVEMWKHMKSLTGENSRYDNCWLLRRLKLNFSTFFYQLWYFWHPFRAHMNTSYFSTTILIYSISFYLKPRNSLNIFSIWHKISILNFIILKSEASKDWTFNQPFSP